MSDLRTRIAALTPEKRALFERLLRERGGSGGTDVAPVSFGQERLWFLQQLAPASAAYNESALFLVNGPLDIAALEASLRQVTQRHDLLRSAIVSGEQGPRLRLSHEYEFALPVVRIAGNELTDLAREEAATPFDLARAPLMRTKLFQMSGHEFALCVTAHHAICDGWSLGRFVGEVLEYYGAHRSGADPSLVRPAIQYADYARRQRDAARSGAFDAQVEYFVRRLKGAPAVLEFPTDHARPQEHRGLGARRHLSLPADVTSRLKAISRRENATLFMTTLTAFKALLMRHTGVEDIVVGTTAANRTSADVEDLIGFFVNTLALRTDLSGNPRFTEALQRVRQSCIGAFSHQSAPFEQVVDRLGIPRRLGYAPLTQVTFSFENAPMPSLELADLVIRPQDNYQDTSKVDVTVSIREKDGCLAGYIEYDTDLFDDDRMERFGAHFCTLLTAVARDPNARLADLTYLTTAELVAIRTRGTGPRPPGPPEPFLERFERYAAAHPNEPAVVASDEVLTYGELNARADRVARSLHAKGVDRDVRVVLALPRSLELIVAMLAVLKAGGAFVPVDVTHPLDRISLIIDDAKPRVVLTDRRDRLSAKTSATVIVLDETGEAQGQLCSDESGADLAYVIYTSGTTGCPKGVMVTHDGLAEYLAWAADTYDARPGRPSALHTSAAFDLTVTSVFVPLATGGRIQVIPEEDDVTALAAWLQSSRDFGVLKVTPAHVRMLSELIDPAVLQALRGTLVVGGEALHAEHLHALRAGAPGVRIVNEYGPTETVVGCVAHEMSADDPWGGPVPIGLPLAGTQVHVLDGWLRPVPIGIPGELYVSGSGVARGYHDDPVRTATRFVATESGERMYRTGDLVRYRADGVLEYLGRTDAQVKLNGFRIEPEEIESALLGCPGVAAAAVALVPGPAGEPHLAGYVVAHDGANLSDAEVLGHLRRRVPAHMVPALIVELDALPLTEAGKVDRAALPEPRRAERPAFTPPSGGTEQALAGLWSLLLGCDRVGRDDDFFALGGQSVLAAQLIGRLRAAFGVELSVRAVFEAGTLRLFAQRLGAAMTESATVAPPIVPAARGGYLPLSLAQERLWFLEQLEPGSPAYHVPAVLHLRGLLNVPALRASINDVIARHETLRTLIGEAVDGEPTQVILSEYQLDVPVIKLDAWADAERMALEEARRPFDLAAAPPVRASLLRISDRHHVLLVTLHHIACDGWSIAVLTREIGAAYSARVTGRRHQPPPLAVQYGDFAVWQRRLLRGSVLDNGLAYWCKRLEGAPAQLELPSEDTGQTGGERIGWEVPAHVWQAAVAAGARFEATPFMVLLAAWQAVLGRWSGQDDVVVGVPVANRERPELEGLIGLLLNTLPLRTDLSGRPSFGALLTRVREGVLADLAQQQVPFEKIVEIVAPDRDVRSTPLFQTSLAFQNTPSPSFELAGLAAEPRQAQTGATKFALTLTVTEHERGLLGTLEYDKARFRRKTAEKLLAHVELLLHRAAIRPDIPLSEIEILDAAEREHVLHRWNDAPPPQARPLVHRAFETVAGRSPDTLALVDAAGGMSYGEANHQANQLARHLTALDVGPGTRVAIRLNRGTRYAVAMLAVLKAGACFVPLDPTHPVGRAIAMMRFADVAALITDTTTEDAYEPVHGIRKVLLDRDRAVIGQHSQDNPNVPVRPGDLAYLIFTSGSTGQPKPVAIEHGHLACYVAGVRERLELPENANYAVVSTPSADLGHTMIFPALCGGATLHIPAADLVSDGLSLADYFRNHRIDCVKIVPSHLAALFAEAGADVLPRERLVLGGEAISAEFLGKLLDAAPDGCRIFNHYGPTETTVGVLTAQVVRSGSTVPVGLPLPGVQAYVLDSAMRPVPVDVAGELYIGGETVARGYHASPVQTAERFVADPFGRRPGGRLYRTGDKVRRRACGAIEFLGRLDDQVKFRGYRVEPAEIERALLEHPEVIQAAVMARSGPHGPCLIAFLGARNGLGDGIGPVREALRQVLPEPMVPAAFVVMDALPRTANGKIDRLALSRIDVEPDNERASYAAPATPTEKVLHAIWAEVLGVRDFGLHDNFFYLGGHSLLAMQVLARVRRQWGAVMSVRTLFEAPTLGQLACRIDSHDNEGAVETSTPLAAVRRPERIPLAFAQRRIWFLNQLDVSSPVYNIVVALKMTGSLDVAALTLAVADVVERHETLRTIIPLIDGVPVQQVMPVAEVGRVVEGPLTADGEEELRRVTAEFASRGFDVSTELPIRIGIIRVSESVHTVVMVVHHIAADGLSKIPLARDLMRAYSARLAGQAPQWVPLAVQYADFTLWQRQSLGDEGDPGSMMEAEKAFWVETLAGIPQVLELPHDRPRPHTPSYSGDSVKFVVPMDLTRRLYALARDRRTTPFMVVHAALAVLLSKLGTADDVVIGVPMAGRDEAVLDDLVGMFVNTLALRTRVVQGQPFAEFLAAVRDADLAAFSHARIPFERVVGAVDPQRSTAHNPLFQVMLAFQNLPDSVFTLPNLAVESIADPLVTSRFDLEWVFTEAFDQAGEITELSGSLVYAADLFDAGTVRAFAERFIRVLGEVTANPGVRIGEVDLLSAEERARELTQRHGRTEPLAGETLAELFHRRVALSGDDVAVIEGSSTLTYRELGLQVNRLAHWLIRQGVGSESLVAVKLPPGTDFVVAVYATLVTGGAYVPIGIERPLLVIDRAVSERARAEASPAGAIDGLGPLSSASAACVLSTGEPMGRHQGVVVTHRAVVNQAAWFVGEHGITAQDAVLQSAPITLGASTLELFAPLLSGGRMVIAKPGGDAEHAEETLVAITVLRPSGTTVHSVFAPDAAVLSVTELPNPQAWDDGHAVPVGSGTWNTKLFVLDAALRLVPVGVTGELYVGGSHIARGYRHRSGLTAERFIASPFTAGERLYRTGKLARWNRDGLLEQLSHDRAELSAPGTEKPTPATPRTPAEETVAAVFAEVLRLDQVSVADNFFELGGDSLLAMRVVARLSKAVGTRINVRELFDHQTVEGFAARIVELEAKEPEPRAERPRLIPRDRSGQSAG